MQAAAQPSFAPSSQLSLISKVLYGIGEIANSVKIVTFGLYSLFFATSVMRVSGTWIGAVGFLAMTWDAIIDPYIGHLTDGARAAKRYGFMLAGALTMGLGFWAFFSPPRNLPIPTLIAWLLAASFVVRTATSMYTIPYYATGANLSQDYHERTTITGIRGFASTIGVLLTASLSVVVFFPERVPGVDPKLNADGYSSMGLAFGSVMSIVALIGLWPLRRMRNQPGPVEVQSEVVFFASVRKALGNRSFCLLLTASSLVFMAMTVNSALQLYYLKYYVEVNSSKTISSAQGAFFGAGLIGTLVWLPVSRRFDKRRLYILSASITSILMLGALFLFGEGTLFGTRNAFPLLIGYGIAGFFNCVLWFIPQSMLADIADESEWSTGSRCEGALFGILSFFQQIAMGAAILLAGTLLEHFVKLRPLDASQSATTVYRIGLACSIVPSLLFLAAALLMLAYKLTRDRLGQLQAELVSRRVTAFAK